MFNLIKMELYRMFHSVSTWVILAFTVGIAFFCTVMTNMDLDAIAQDPAYAVQMEEEIQTDTEGNEDREMGLYTETDPEWVIGKIDAGEFISSQLVSGLLVLLCVIFAAVFVNAEQKNGYIKNIAGAIPNRGALALSKLAALAVQTAVMIALFAVSETVLGFILWGERFTVNVTAELLVFFGTQYLLHLGFAALMMFLCILTKSSAFGMTAGILMTMGIFVPFYSIINRAVYEIRPSWEFDISLYMLDGNIGLAGLGADADVMVRAAAVGAAFIVLCALFSMLILKRRDVR